MGGCCCPLWRRVQLIVVHGAVGEHRILPDRQEGERDGGTDFFEGSSSCGRRIHCFLYPIHRPSSCARRIAAARGRSCGRSLCWVRLPMRRRRRRKSAQLCRALCRACKLGGAGSGCCRAARRSTPPHRMLEQTNVIRCGDVVSLVFGGVGTRVRRQSGYVAVDPFFGFSWRWE